MKDLSVRQTIPFNNFCFRENNNVAKGSDTASGISSRAVAI